MTDASPNASVIPRLGTVVAVPLWLWEYDFLLALYFWLCRRNMDSPALHTCPGIISPPGVGHSDSAEIFRKIT